jgi:beta-glucosidase
VPVAGPIAYTLQVSMDGTQWGSPVAQGSGAAPTTVIAFTPVQAKFVRITQTGAAAGNEQWAIAQLRVYAK